MPTIEQLVTDGNFAEIMRQCLGEIDKQNPDNQAIAYRQNVTLRGHIQTIYNGQAFNRKEREPIHISCIAAACHQLLSEGKSVVTILTIPNADILSLASELERKFRAYNRSNMP